MADLRREPYGFSLTRGGPLYRLLVRLRVGQGPLRTWVLPVVTWLPLAIAAIVRFAVGQGGDPVVADFAVEARLLVALPLLMVAERYLDGQCSGAIGNFYRGAIVDRSTIERITTDAERWRDSRGAELVILVLTVVDTALVFGGHIGAWSGHAFDGAWQFSRYWYGMVGIPIMQFMMLRWIWRWIIWGITVVRLSRHPLSLIATHPDRVAGLGPLTWPLKGYMLFVLALSSVLAGALSTQIVEGETTLGRIAPGILVYALGALAVGLLPLVVYTPRIYFARKTTIAAYSDFSLMYMRRFDAKWIQHPQDAGEVLGTNDLQSLNALQLAFDIASSTRLTLFSNKVIFQILLCALLPLIPIALSSTSVEGVVTKLFSTLLGGLPI